jgi:hypothetical protein
MSLVMGLAIGSDLACCKKCMQVVLANGARDVRLVSVGFHEEFHRIKYADVAKKECESFMGCEESFITMKLHRHSYLVFSLGNCAYETCTETSLTNWKD